MRNLLAWLALLVSVLILFIPFVLVTLLLGNPRFIYSGSRLVIRLVLFLVGVKFEVFGREHIPQAPFLLVCNHLSVIDGPLMVGIMPQDLHVLIKAETRRYPLVGILFKLGGFVFVDRKSERRSAEALLKTVAQIKKKGHAFLIFPEGTRSQAGGKLPFKKGGFMIAIKAGIPILPARIHGTYECMPPHTKWIRRGPVKVHFFPVVNLQAVAPLDAENLCRHIEDTYYGDMKREEYVNRIPGSQDQ